MSKILFLFLISFFIITGCKDEYKHKKFFTNGKKTETGLVWKRKSVTEEKILKDYSKELVFEDNFDRHSIGDNWYAQGGAWSIIEGKLFSSIARNRNLVLAKHPLPENCLVEFEIKSESDAVDMKFNMYGTGEIKEHGDGYIFIMGGWNNSVSVIAKNDEHEKNRVVNRDKKWKKGRTYRVNVIRLDKRIYWFVNGNLFLARYDEEPLLPSHGYDRFSFANWESWVLFDNLSIYRLVEK